MTKDRRVYGIMAAATSIPYAIDGTSTAYGIAVSGWRETNPLFAGVVNGSPVVSMAVLAALGALAAFLIFASTYRLVSRRWPSDKRRVALVLIASATVLGTLHTAIIVSSGQVSNLLGALL